jgi:hypothetical protein
MDTPFTYAGYRQLLRDYSGAGYQFGSFHDFSGTGAPLVVMRHDIDFDLGAALEIAKVEREEGVAATYFFLLTTDHYSLFSSRGRDMVNEILALGHHLGLHFDCAAYAPELTEAELAAACQKEVHILETWFDRPAQIVSYHRPSPRVLEGSPALSAPLPHTYMARFMKEMKYCSDSRGEWRFGDPRSTPAFAERKPMHILIHPIWWKEDRVTPEETLRMWLESHIDATECSIEANCSIYRRAARSELTGSEQ